MIATVRIAPVANWCEPVRRYLGRHPEIAAAHGKSVDILTHTMVTSPTCGGREWMTTNGTGRQLAALAQGALISGHPERLVCEHMVEID